MKDHDIIFDELLSYFSKHKLGRSCLMIAGIIKNKLRRKCGRKISGFIYEMK